MKEREPWSIVKHQIGPLFSQGSSTKGSPEQFSTFLCFKFHYTAKYQAFDDYLILLQGIKEEVKIKCIINVSSQHRKCFMIQQIASVQSFPQREKYSFKVCVNSCLWSAAFSVSLSKRSLEKTNNSAEVCSAKRPFELPLIKSLSSFCYFIPPGDARSH